MGADLGAHSARTCSRRLSPAHLGTVLTWARTHSCRLPHSGNIPGGQGVAGSNPAVPTGRRVFSNTLMPSPEPTKEPFHREMTLPEAHAHHCPGLLPGHSSTRQSPRNPAVKGSKIAEPPGPCTATPAAANPRTPSPARPAPATSDATPTGMRSPLGQTATTVASDTANALLS
jgi:hypothetical protein